MARILCIFGLLCSVFITVENRETEEGFENLQLQQDELPFLRKLHDNLEPREKEDLMGLIQKLSKSEDETLYEDLKDTTKQETSEEMNEKSRREENDGLTTRPSTKPCRVFFWKSWASC